MNRNDISREKWKKRATTRGAELRESRRTIKRLNMKVLQTEDQIESLIQRVKELELCKSSSKHL